ncbi:MAG TPA: hypothetical protein VKA48_11795 [Gammaproteobacteria bacterium]|nr:hypothetical protein [Gammaproteobacteria bacterium]
MFLDILAAFAGTMSVAIPGGIIAGLVERATQSTSAKPAKPAKPVED